MLLINKAMICRKIHDCVKNCESFSKLSFCCILHVPCTTKSLVNPVRTFWLLRKRLHISSYNRIKYIAICSYIASYMLAILKVLHKTWQFLNWPWPPTRPAFISPTASLFILENVPLAMATYGGNTFRYVCTLLLMSY